MQHYTKAGTGRSQRERYVDPDVPERPPEPPAIPAGDYLPPAALEFAGQRVEVQLRQPPWNARSDQVAALIDGEWLIVTARWLAKHMAEQLPRMMTRKQRAEG